jgi:hypothetical protein
VRWSAAFVGAKSVDGIGNEGREGWMAFERMTGAAHVGCIHHLDPAPACGADVPAGLISIKRARSRFTAAAGDFAAASWRVLDAICTDGFCTVPRLP